jgi:hypothetical protein
VTLDSSMHQYLFLLLTKLAFSLRRALDAPVVVHAVRGEGHVVLVLRHHAVLVLQDATERFDCSNALWSSSLLACLDAGGVTDKDEKEKSVNDALVCNLHVVCWYRMAKWFIGFRNL